MTSQQWSPSTMWQHSWNEFCIPFHRSCSFFPFWLVMTCPVCCHAKPPSGCFSCVCAYCTCVYKRESVKAGVRAGHGGWHVIRDQRGQRHTSRYTSACVCVCVWVRAHIPSTLVTAAVQCCGDSPSSANEERQYGNVATLWQQGTFSSALVYFFSFNWKERKTEYTKGHHKVTWVLTIHESHKLTDIACWAW